MNDPGGHGGGYPPGAPPAANELPSPGRPLRRRQVRTRMGGVGEVPEHLARAGARSAAPGERGSTHPPPEIRDRAATEQAGLHGARVPPRIDSHHVLEAVRADAGGQGPGLVIVVTHASGRERTEVFRSTEVAIGRDRNNDLVLTGDGISRRHALLTLADDNSCTIIDLGSTNGTFVNERPIENSPTQLTQKDFVTLGEYALRVRPFGEEADVDPSTMQFDVAIEDVIVTNAEPAEAPPRPIEPPSVITAPPVSPHARQRTQQPPPLPASPSSAPPSVGRRPREHGVGMVATAGTQPAPDSQSPPGGSAAAMRAGEASPVALSPAVAGARPEVRTAEIELDDESDEGQGTMAMVDTSQLEQAVGAAGGDVSMSPAELAAPAPQRGPIAPPVFVPSASPVRPPIAPVVPERIAPPIVAAAPIDDDDGFFNEMTVSEQQTRVKELSDMPPPMPFVPTTDRPGVVVSHDSAPPLPDDSAARRPRTLSGATGLPQTGPRSRPFGEPISKTPIGMPAPPARPPAVVVPQQQVDAHASARSSPLSTPEPEPMPARPPLPPPPRSVRSGPASSAEPASGPPRSVPPRSAPSRSGSPRSVPPRSGSPRSAPPRTAPPRSVPPGSLPSESAPTGSAPGSGTGASVRSAPGVPAALASAPSAPRSAPEAPRSAPDHRDDPSTGPDSIVVAGRVTTDSSAALEALLNDPDVSRVTVHVRRVDVERRGSPSLHDGFDFETEEGLSRAVARICERGGVVIDPAAPFVRGVLSSGWELFMVRPPVAPNGHLAQLRRVATTKRSLGELTEEGWLSKPMATLVAKCHAARCNLLIVGERDDDAEVLAAAVAATASVPPLWVVRDEREAPKGYPAIVLDDDPEVTLEACADLAIDAVVFPRLPLAGWHALLRVVRGGRDGVVARLRGPSLEAALDRTATGLAAHVAERTGGNSAPPEVFRAWLGTSFVLVIEVGRVRDGVPRVLRIVELGGNEPRVLFTFNPEPAPRGSFDIVVPPEATRKILAARGLWDD